MFGEDLMIGKRETTIDGKNRVILGASTYAEKGDELAMLLSNDKTYLKLFRRELIETKIRELLEQESKAKDAKEQSFIEQKLSLYKDSVVSLPKVEAQIIDDDKN